MRLTYNKLVRDKIPDIIQMEGKICSVEVMSEVDYRKTLLDKLIEEAQEARQAPPERLAIEIADLQEVISAILSAFDISADQIQDIKQQRHGERGGFEQKLRLLWTEDGSGVS